MIRRARKGEKTKGRNRRTQCAASHLCLKHVESIGFWGARSNCTRQRGSPGRMPTTTSIAMDIA
eukprot:2285444-Lingulodinium_polyedra.AAC.1